MVFSKNNPSQKPRALGIEAESIPPEVRQLSSWVIWRWEFHNNKWTKPPYQVLNTAKKASHSNPDTWSTYQYAVARSRSGLADGIGFVFAEDDPYCGIDLDGCRDPETGKLADWAEKIITDINSYSEVSPSGEGVKILTKATLPGDGQKNERIEMYDRLRYFTLTGQHLPGTPKTIEDRQEAVAQCYRAHFPVKEATKTNGLEVIIPGSACWADAEILENARHAANGDKFRGLWEADEDFIAEQLGFKKDDGSPDWSRADAALCRMLAFWIGDNPDRIARLFRQAPLCRDKWERADYRRRTIDLALQDAEFYVGSLPNGYAERIEEIVAPLTTPPVAHEGEKADLGRHRADPMTAYLWHGHHGKRLTDAQRAKRIASIEDVRGLMPSSGFFPEYLRLVLPTSDCAPIFHLGAALALVSVLANRKIWMQWRSGRLSALVWNALIAGSTEARKSSAINEVRDLLRDFRPDVLMPNSFSIEALYMRLGVEMNEGETLAQVRERVTLSFPDLGVGIFHANELGALLATLDKNFNDGATEMLTEWYDCPPYFLDEKKTAGRFFVREPFVPILGASTPAWLTSHQNKLEGGFYPRWLFFYASGKDYDLSFPDFTDLEQRDTVMKHLTEVSQAAGLFSPTPEALDVYHAWYGHALDECIPVLRAWVDRMRTAVFKVAMLYQTSTTKAAGAITEDTMRLAIKLIDRLKQDLHGLFEYDLAFTLDEAGLKHVKKLIDEMGSAGIAHSDLLRRLSPMTADTLKKYITTLVEQESISQEVTQTKTKKRIKYVRIIR